MKITYKQLGHFGALGNQLWEIASTVCIGRKIGATPVFPHWAYEPYFSIPSDYFSDDLPFELDLSGQYLQDNEYLNSNFLVIKDLFAPSFMVEQRIKLEFPKDLSEYTAVHVRRANNLTLPNHHPVQSVEYFEKALDKLIAHKIIVFSDDLDWCRKQEVFRKAVFGLENDKSVDIFQLTGAHPVPLDTVAIDLLAMAKCKEFVISNSTFSWWSAYLSESDRVVYPLNWYGPAVAADYTLMIQGLGWIGI